METARLTALLAGRAAAASVNGAMPTFEGLEFRYALHPLPPGRLPFRRWRWELWHGPRMLAAGWRVTERDAGRAICKYAATYAHRLFGLPEPARDAHRDQLVSPGSIRRLALGSVTCLLVPKALEQAGVWEVAT